MGEHLARQWHAGGHQKGRPVDGVKPHDILADDMRIGRPMTGIKVRIFIGIAQRRDVIGQGVDPDVHHVVRVPRHRHAPIEGGARDRKIAQARFDEAHDLIAPRFRLDEFGIGLVVRHKFVGVFRQLEEIAGFLDPLHRRALGRQFGAVRAR